MTVMMVNDAQLHTLLCRGELALSPSPGHPPRDAAAERHLVRPRGAGVGNRGAASGRVPHLEERHAHDGQAARPLARGEA